VGVETTDGSLTAGEVVLATGAWAPRLARTAGVWVPVEGGKGYHVELELGDGVPGLPVLLHEARVIATPLPRRVRLAGTLELAGLDLSVSRRRVDAVLAAGRRGLPRLAARAVTQVWAGLRPCAPDGLPIVGRPAALDGLVLATGHAMMGLTLAPVTGRLVREIVLGTPPSHPLGPLSPDRFRAALG
jgi:D-amino-acid dehydrogenase